MIGIILGVYVFSIFSIAINASYRIESGVVVNKSRYVGHFFAVSTFLFPVSLIVQMIYSYLSSDYDTGCYSNNPNV